MKHTKHRIVLLMVMLAVIVMLPLASAEEKTDTSAFYSEMGGKEVNAGDFLKVIDPVNFGNLTNEQRAEFYKLKVTVPDLSADTAKTTGQDEAHSSGRIVYTVWHAVDLAPIPYGINWFANSRASTIFPDMHVTAQLFYSADQSSWSQVDTGSANTYLGSYVETLKVKWFPQTGYYRVASTHWGTFPPDASPSVYFQSLLTGTMYYS